MFELEETFITEHALTEDQVKAITAFGKTKVESIQDEFAGKANENAEKIIQGARSYVQKQTGVEPKEKEKLAEYVQRAWDTFSKDKTEALEAQRTELEKKLKSSPGDEGLKAKIAELTESINGYKEKAANYDKLIDEEIPTKYETLLGKYGDLKRQVAFQSVKPNFPDTVNKFEADHYWKEFQAEVQAKNNIEIDDEGKAWAVSKENDMKRSLLSDMLTKNEAIQKLVQGRQQTGPGGAGGGKVTVDGLPFKLSEGADSAEITRELRNYLASEEKLDPIRDKNKYTERFTELYAIAKGKKKAA